MADASQLGALLDKVAKKQRVDTVARKLDEMLDHLQSWEDTSEDDTSRAAALAALGSRLEAVGVEQCEQSCSSELQSAISKALAAPPRVSSQPSPHLHTASASFGSMAARACVARYR